MNTLKQTCSIVTVLLLLSLPVHAQTEEDPYNDAEVASIAVTANQVDITYAELAKTKSSNQEVIDFANTMISDHTAVINQAVELATKLGVEPEDNDLSRKLSEDSETTLETLRTKSGNAFDRAYVDNEVAYHTAVIGAVRDVLIPTTDNAELKELLQAVLPALETHLEHAKMLQTKLAG